MSNNQLFWQCGFIAGRHNNKLPMSLNHYSAAFISGYLYGTLIRHKVLKYK